MPQSANQPASERRKRSAQSGDSVSNNRPKRSQRERLVEAMIELSARVGYQRVSIAQLSSRAGVSSATFYEQFEGKEDCLVAAYQAAAQRVFHQMQPVAANSDWSDAARVILGGLMRGLQSDPDAGRVLFIEVLAGGSRLREERGRVLGGFGRTIGPLMDRTPTDDTLDTPTTAIVGAVRSIVSRYLRTHAQDQLPSLVDDLIIWMGSYAIQTGKTRWRGPRVLLAAAPAQEPSLAARAPVRLPRGRHGLPAGVVARSQRTRIIYATAEVMMAKGYADATVADIVAAAGVARDVFYEHFTNKESAFLEAQDHPTQYILDSCAAAYFAAEDWPERVWNCLHILIRLIVENPALSHLRLVGCYAAGPAAIRRAEEITRSFTIFLEEGYRYRPEAHGLPRLCSQAITGAIFELIQRYFAVGQADQLPRRLPQLVYITIAPFTGAEEATRLVERMSAQHPPIEQ